MANVNVSEQTGLVLNWLVTLVELDGKSQQYLEPEIFIANHDDQRFRYCDSWNLGGPILDKKKIMFQTDEAGIRAYLKSQGTSGVTAVGEDHLIAAMRCHVIHELGNSVKVPDELTK